jgi:glycosyltransferase involved in cell wall biosynthesis
MVFVQTSEFEGHPKALLEAMACGVAVIGSDVPGIREIIRHGENGWLCNPEPVAIKNSIEQLMSNNELRHKLGKAARQDILMKYSLQEIASQELALLEGLL